VLMGWIKKEYLSGSLGTRRKAPTEKSALLE
jgi:hypothetical protein